MRPSGTVTFLFTDIEGSTRLWELDPDGMREAIKLHDALMSRVFGEGGGYVFKTVGDAFCVAFSDAAKAIDTAVRAQRELNAVAWPKPSLELSVRMALLTGEAEESGGDYFGQPLNRVARLLGLAAGGQVIAGSEVAEVSRERDDIYWTDLGKHRLRDLMRPVSVFQLHAEGLRSEFPPLKSLASQPTNLPEQLTPFVGREAELEIVRDMVEQNRLVTLLGAGGVGKTRLALQLAADMMDSFPDGVWLVELAPISDPGRVGLALAEAMKVKTGASRDSLDAALGALGDGCNLIVLDNCEHLVGSAAETVEAVLRAAKKTKMLATSREPLRIAGEQRFRVPSLGVPRPEDTDQAASSSESVQLFVERARTVVPHFWLTAENTKQVAEICRRLDGIPLAVELAASRLRSLSPTQILERLDQRLQLLTSGSRTALPRQQTLRATLEWSHELLEDKERTLFRRLSVFVGGWSLDAAEAVCAFDGIEAYEVLDLLDSLVEKSLVQFDEEGRYGFLETMRAFASEQAHAAREAEALRRQHLDYLDSRAANWRSRILSDMANVYREIHADIENCLSAIEYAGRSDKTADKGLRIISSIVRYWQMGGHPEFAIARMERLMAAGPSDKTSIAQAHSALGILYFVSSRHEKAVEQMQSAVDLYREAGEQRLMVNVMMNLATAQASTGPLDRAEDHARQVLQTAEREGFDECIAPMHSLLSQISYAQGDFETALQECEAALSLWQEATNQHGVGVATNNLAHSLRRLGRYSEATEKYMRALEIRLEIADRQGILWVAEGVAKLELALDNEESATVLASAATAMRERLNITQLKIDQAEWAATIEAIQAVEGWEAWWAEGQSVDEDGLVSRIKSALGALLETASPRESR